MTDKAEPKPPWRDVPASVRRQTEVVLGATVRRAVRVWGGYAPSATFRVWLSNGQRAIFKGITDLSAARMRRVGFSNDEIARQNTLQRRILADEERTYRDLGQRLRPWAPAFYGSFQVEQWLVLLLEDVGPARVPPWTDDLARAALLDYAAFHTANLGESALPEWLRRDRHHRFAQTWERLASEPGGLDGLAGLAAQHSAIAHKWVDKHLHTLNTAALELVHAPAPGTLLHFDTRSDNLRIQPEGQLRLFDWPYVAVGPHEFDVAAFAQSIASEGGPEPDVGIRWYAKGIAVREPMLRAAVAALAGYFADRAWRPPIPGVPRVRSVQRKQLRTSLSWCARVLELEPPTWLRTVPD